jgi:hypothetical protein
VAATNLTLMKSNGHSALFVAAKRAVAALLDCINILEESQIFDGHLCRDTPVHTGSWRPHVDLDLAQC